jgi:hypothetical protein
MLVISFDICRTLRRATTQLRISAGERWGRFAAYSATGWLTPMVLVAFTVAVDLMQESSGMPKEIWPKFGQSDLCWFSSKKALLVYFAVPFACIVCINVVLFVLSTCMVYTAMRDNAVAHTMSCGPKTNFYLYLRLAIIMGLTWTIGLVATFVDKEAVWYGFVAFNTAGALHLHHLHVHKKGDGQHLKALWLQGLWPGPVQRDSGAPGRRVVVQVVQGQLHQAFEPGLGRLPEVASGGAVVHGQGQDHVHRAQQPDQLRHTE